MCNPFFKPTHNWGGLTWYITSIYIYIWYANVCNIIEDMNVGCQSKVRYLYACSYFIVIVDI